MKQFKMLLLYAAGLAVAVCTPVSESFTFNIRGDENDFTVAVAGAKNQDVPEQNLQEMSVTEGRKVGGQNVLVGVVAPGSGSTVPVTLPVTPSSSPGQFLEGHKNLSDLGLVEGEDSFLDGTTPNLLDPDDIVESHDGLGVQGDSNKHLDGLDKGLGLEDFKKHLDRTADEGGTQGGPSPGDSNKQLGGLSLQGFKKQLGLTGMQRDVDLGDSDNHLNGLGLQDFKKLDRSDDELGSVAGSGNTEDKGADVEGSQQEPANDSVYPGVVATFRGVAEKTEKGGGTGGGKTINWKGQKKKKDFGLGENPALQLDNMG